MDHHSYKEKQTTECNDDLYRPEGESDLFAALSCPDDVRQINDIVEGQQTGKDHAGQPGEEIRSPLAPSLQSGVKDLDADVFPLVPAIGHGEEEHQNEEQAVDFFASPDGRVEDISQEHIHGDKKDDAVEKEDRSNLVEQG